MATPIEINCRKVYDSGKDYISYCEEIIEIQKDLDTVASNINELWNGLDNNNFLYSFNEHIKDLDLLINFLGSNGTILKDTASEHSNIDLDFATQMERSGEEDDEHRL